MKRLIPASLALSVLFSYGCASTYKPIRPETVHYNYSEVSTDASISTAYAYDQMSMRNNRKYAKKELKNGVRVVSVKVVNNTTEPINIGKDCRLLMDNREILPMEGIAAAQVIKQGVPIYLLYALLTLNLTVTDQKGFQDQTILPIGVPIAAGNMLVASSANNNMKQELIANSILNKTVGPGETAYGIVCLNGFTSGPLRFELRKIK